MNRRSRSRLGSHRRAGWSVRASICIQAVSSTASATIAHQIWFWAKSNSSESAQAGVLGDVDAVLAAGPAAVADLEVGELGARPAGAGVGGERGDAVPDDER